ncbi:MAG TPA: phosphate/phosphite/phosphonate ABC transporter substrate-binding protein [Gammaproteobacteria bacterium]
MKTVRRPGHAAFLRVILLGAAAIVLAACGDDGRRGYEPEYAASPARVRAEYIFGIHPQRNPEKLHAVFGPLIDYLNGQVPDVRLVFEASRNYAAFDRKIAARHFAFVLPNPYETLLAIDKGYRVFAKMGNDADLRGLIIARRDSGIDSVDDLRGKAVSFPAPTALAATMMPEYFLHTRGLDVRRDIEARYVGSMESSLLNIHRGNVAAGTAYPPAWRMFIRERPGLARELEVLWETDPLPNNSVMARDDMPPELVERVGRALVSMHTTGAGRRVLAEMDLPYFELAADSTYDPVRAFLKTYRETFGPDQ